ncbi:FAD-linked oxidase [Plakobranchus ocellatus]|uniref:FAD-linked oxidase n=1 Tax=Plakobranchus ocellatus TaxID=259542 RepID=A0AAV3ZV00_9GAST|nr:FAD-linked oxidase [Plakobranchus ocellatus]
MATSKVLIQFLVLTLILSGSLEYNLRMYMDLRRPPFLLRVLFSEETAEELYRCLCSDMNVACNLTIKRRLVTRITIKEKTTNDLANHNPAYVCQVPETRSRYINNFSFVRQRKGEEYKNGCDNGITCQMYHINFANLKACNFPCINLQFNDADHVYISGRLDNQTSPEEGKCEPFTTSKPVAVRTQRLTTSESTTVENTKTIEITTSSLPSLAISSENQEGKNDNQLTFISTGVAVPAIIIVALVIVSFIWWKRKHMRSNASSMSNAKKESKSCKRPFSENSGHRDMANNVTEDRHFADQYEDMSPRTDMRQDTSHYPDTEYLNSGELREYEEISPRTGMRQDTSHYPDTEYLNSGELREYEDISPRTDMRQDTSQYPDTEYLNSGELREYEDISPRTDMRQDTGKYPQTEYLNLKAFRNYEETTCRMEMMKDTSQ